MRSARLARASLLNGTIYAPAGYDCASTICVGDTSAPLGLLTEAANWVAPLVFGQASTQIPGTFTLTFASPSAARKAVEQLPTLVEVLYKAPCQCRICDAAPSVYDQLTSYIIRIFKPMVVRISTIDEVRDMLVKLNINERDVHKSGGHIVLAIVQVLTSLQMRDNWLQYLSQKIDEDSPKEDVDHEAIGQGLDQMIRQRSDPPRTSGQSGRASDKTRNSMDREGEKVPRGQYTKDMLGSQGFLGEEYIPVEDDSDDESEPRRRDVHVCDTLGPNPKVMIAHMGTKDCSPLFGQTPDLQPDDQDSSGNVQSKLDVGTKLDGTKFDGRTFSTILETPMTTAGRDVVTGGHEATGREVGSQMLSSSSSSTSSMDAEPEMEYGEEEDYKDLSRPLDRCPPVYTVVGARVGIEPKKGKTRFCVAVMTAPMKKQVLPTSGLTHFSKSCALRARAAH
ncbi:hypothetical protein GNI_011900 [Gregarina niphandrodes]|uniref:Uncharacterized protein n=1 Tax=Gregarina niphandrodes TaxID=110365 RepID=A0A023BCQ1_GRENI|nr:hypothetical protein GNI_011900 [Gregarina niphandrodes]EZG85281.1 hypothetical protein GNI_011900 [Gregarina niphandrodes]|eukprot:XP_011128832.1 hypothetical protein GNI_011900 [Gregarina niphandrodes]